MSNHKIDGDGWNVCMIVRELQSCMVIYNGDTEMYVSYEVHGTMYSKMKQVTSLQAEWIERPRANPDQTCATSRRFCRS